MAAPPTTVDQKLAFQQCDARPSYELWVGFRRNLNRFGTKTCKQGYSLADCYNAVDPGGENWPGGPGPVFQDANGVVHHLHGLPVGGSGLPGAPPGTQAEKDQWAARRSRLKEGAGFLSLHVCNKLVTDRMAEAHNPSDSSRGS